MRARRISARAGFSLLEVVLAIGIFSLAVIALVGLTGPLLRQMRAEGQSAELEPVLTATRAWLADQSATDFSGLRDSLEGGTRRLYGYRLEPLTAESPAGWRVGDAASFASAAGQDNAALAIGGPRVFLLDLQGLSAPPGAADRSYFAIRVELRDAPVPAPDENLNQWSTRWHDAPASQTVYLVARRT